MQPVRRLVRASGMSQYIESLIANYSQLTPVILQRKKTCSRRMYEVATIVIRFQKNDMFFESVREPFIGQRCFKVATCVCSITAYQLLARDPLFLDS